MFDADDIFPGKVPAEIGHTKSIFDCFPWVDFHLHWHNSAMAVGTGGGIFGLPKDFLDTVFTAVNIL